ncbi:alcohol acetyltransferase [Ruminiclostridium herbifermentans]|uniref:Alcohol acetyltransferase n=2 Tax=Ruminiclostridium herbifermentans TaxID=2488810 RepID=A0A4U7JG54_9FIRM|nr:alcohol acetyltransferase [Ruminiclostridium herbifermentans]
MFSRHNGLSESRCSSNNGSVPPRIFNCLLCQRAVVEDSIKELNDDCKNKYERSIPNAIPVNAYDKCNYVAKYDLASSQIQAIMKLDGRLDFNNLVKAVRISVDVEPVFGCHIIESKQLYWKRYEDIDNIEFCTIEETNNTDEAIQSFSESPMDMMKDPMVIVKLIRSDASDILGIKINHVCCDGAGAKEYIRLLSDIYSSIDSGDNSFSSDIRVSSMEDHKRLLDALSKCNPNTNWNPLSQIPLTTWRFPWRNLQTGDLGFSICKLPYGSLDTFNTYAKSKGASINDLILTAVYRAMFEIAKPPYGIPMDVPITIDLRKYLPDNKAEAIRNFSSGVTLKIDRRPNESFESTLSRVMIQTKDIKNRHPSYMTVKCLEIIEKIDFDPISSAFKALSQIINLATKNPYVNFNRCAITLSNVGFISRELLKFGQNTVTDAYILPPTVRAPGILLVASTYNGIISLAVGYYKPSVKKSDMDGLLNKIRDELIEGCSPIQ